MTLEKGLAAFLDALLGKNRSSATIRAYQTDVLQFMTFLHENNVAITDVGDVGKVDVLEYLAALARKGLTGIARARKVSAIREYFRFLEGVGVIQKSPTTGIDTPKGRNIPDSTFALMSIPKCSPWPARTPETTRSCKCFSKPASGSRNSHTSPLMMLIFSSRP